MSMVIYSLERHENKCSNDENDKKEPRKPSKYRHTRVIVNESEVMVDSIWYKQFVCKVWEKGSSSFCVSGFRFEMDFTMFCPIEKQRQSHIQ